MLLRIVILALLLAACAKAEPQLNEIQRAQAEFERQLEKNPCVRRNGNVWESLRYRDCLEFLPAERMHGVWFYGFEESGFIPNVDKVELTRDLMGGNNPEFEILLEIDRSQAIRDFGVPPIKNGCTQAIAVEFIGRRSAKSGPYYTGPKDDVIAVDRLLSARPLGIVSSKFPNGTLRCAQ